MKKTLSVFLCLVLMMLPLSSLATDTTQAGDIVILYENDVHCAVDGYSKISALKQELQESGAHVGVVSSGDYIQGASIGVASKGSYVIDLMNLVGYDALTLGNHEFDYYIPRLLELIDGMDTKPVCCNLEKIGADEPFLEPYTMVSYGDTDIAYIGITTPSTMATSSPMQFKDEEGNYLYTFHPDALHETMQEAIDAAEAEGADYIVALSHLGDQEPSHTVQELIANTEGLDVVLDGHSHSVIEGQTLTDKGGNQVLLSSTGTKLEHIGKLTITAQGSITTELIKTEDYEKTDPKVDAYLQQIHEEFDRLGARKIAVSQVDLFSYDAEGNRLVRNQETNLGDLAADAFRHVRGADIGMMNGGGLRADIPAGDITFFDLLSVFPFNNEVVVVEVTGQVIHDMLELTMMNWPDESGVFPHLSGLTFSMNTSIPSSVTLDENEMFTGVSGPYRVYGIQVLNQETGEYEPLDPTARYTIASQNFMLLEQGSGMSMFEGAEILINDGQLDVQVVEEYLVEHLDAVVGQEYEEMSPNIIFTDGEIPAEEAVDEGGPVPWVALPVAACVLGAALWVLSRKDRKDQP